MLSVEEAQARILAGVSPLPTETVPLATGRGRVLPEPIRATRSAPPADNSAMDGYAVRWADLVAGTPVELAVTDLIPAGGWSDRELQPGEAARIFTGAPIPPGADHVVMQERTKALSGDRVRIDSTGPGPSDNIRRAGEDVAVGDVVAVAGRPLTAPDLALIASQGVAELQVHRRPVVAIVSTGDEVHEPGKELPPGPIYSGNSYALIAAIEEAGGEARYLGIARDTRDSLFEMFARAAGCDATVSIGGVSVGDYDYVRDVLAEMGEQSFWKVAMRPGKPNASGTLHGAPYFGLPGNPVSCLISFLQYVRPALRAMQGCRELYLPTRDATITHDLRSNPRFLFLNRGILSADGTVRTTGPQGSGIASSMSKANCLICVPEGVSQVKSGDVVRVQLLPGAGAAQGEPGLRR
jgi:molybdopterin molybdotransferase